MLYKNVKDALYISLFLGWIWKLLLSFKYEFQVKETKQNAMAILSPYRTATTHNQMIEGSGSPQGINVVGQQPFVSLLEFVSEIYQVSMLFSLLNATWFMKHVIYGLCMGGFMKSVYELFPTSFSCFSLRTEVAQGQMLKRCLWDLK